MFKKLTGLLLNLDKDFEVFNYQVYFKKMVLNLNPSKNK